MSIVFGKGDILFEQRLLACGGFYTGKLDGKWGPLSEASSLGHENKFYDIRAAYGGPFDARSEMNIYSLHPVMQSTARAIFKAANKWATGGLTVSVLSGTRTYAEQDALFKQRPKVTNARGGQSNHNFGVAIDIGLFKGGKYLTGNSNAETKLYIQCAAAVKLAVSHVTWGGDWRSFKDYPHYEYDHGMPLSKVRALFEAGKLVLS